MISGGVIIELNDLNSFSYQVLCIFLTNLQIIFTEVRNPFSGILLNSYCKNFNFFNFQNIFFTDYHWVDTSAAGTRDFCC